MSKLKIFLYLVFAFLGFSVSGAAYAMTVFSPVVEVSASPGETVTGVVKIYNDESQVVLLASSVEAFRAGDETGQPVYLPKTGQGTFLDWFSIEQSEIVLTPKQVGVIPFSIDIPSDAVPGGYYAVIFWEGVSNPDYDKQVNISSRVGTLVFVDVLGDVNRQASLEEFSVDSGVKTKFPVTFNVRIANQGNIHLGPQGSIEIKTLFGSSDLPINQGEHYVLPNSIRNFQVVWGVSNNFWQELLFEFKSFPVGLVTATANVNFSPEDGIEDQSQTISFWFVPVRALMLSIIALLFLIFIVRTNIKVNKIKKEIKKVSPNIKQ